jgi:hypothetical protein
MIRGRTIQARDRLVGKMPVTGELLRGSLLEAYQGLPEMRARRRAPGVRADGDLRRRAHATVSVRRERVAEVRRWLDNYQKLKQVIDDICELNHELLRLERHRRRARRRHD